MAAITAPTRPEHTVEEADEPTVGAPAAPPTNVDADVDVDRGPETTTDRDDRGFLLAIAKGFLIGTVIWAALIFSVMYVVGDLPLTDSLRWAAWIGPWGGLFLGGTFTVGFWSQRHFE